MCIVKAFAVMHVKIYDDISPIYTGSNLPDVAIEYELFSKTSISMLSMDREASITPSEQIEWGVKWNGSITM